MLGRYAFAAGDVAALQHLPRPRERALPIAQVAFPRARTFCLADGKIEAAIEKYYERRSERAEQTPALSLEDRTDLRAAPLTADRREIELKKAGARTTRAYGAHLLKAYVAAQQNARPVAEGRAEGRALAGIETGATTTGRAPPRSTRCSPTTRPSSKRSTRPSQRKEPDRSPTCSSNPLFRSILGQRRAPTKAREDEADRRSD